jgi:hypothetical protein
VIMPPRPDPHPGGIDATARLDPGCGGDNSCAPGIVPFSLQLTINSRDAGSAKPPAPDATIDSIDELFAALRACWDPPASDEAREGVQMSVRFSFKRNGQLIGPPFVTYTTPGTQAATRQVYRDAINAALTRCTPVHFSSGFSAAIAGQPLSIRYVEDRPLSAESQRP